MYTHVLIIIHDVHGCVFQPIQTVFETVFVSVLLFVCVQWKELERELMEEENRRILEFSHQQQAREEQRMSVLKKQEEAKAAAQKHLSDKISTIRQEMEEMDRCV